MRENTVALDEVTKAHGVINRWRDSKAKQVDRGMCASNQENSVVIMCLCPSRLKTGSGFCDTMPATLMLTQ